MHDAVPRRRLSFDDEVVHLEIAPGTVVRLARGAVARRLGEEPVDEEPAPADVPSATAADRAVDAPVPPPPPPTEEQ